MFRAEWIADGRDGLEMGGSLNFALLEWNHSLKKILLSSKY